MKDILINATIISDKNTGQGVYTLQLLQRVCPLLKKNSISFDILCGDAKFLPDDLRSYAKVIKYTGKISRNVKINLAAKDDYKLVWSTTQHGMSFGKRRQIITIHDITPILYPEGRKYQEIYYKYILPMVIKKCKCIFTVSESTKNDLLKYYKIPENDIFITSESINMPPKVYVDFDTLSDRYRIKPKKYFVIIGIHFEYKNIQAVVDAYDENIMKDYKIVIIGKDNNDYGEYLKDYIKKNSKSKNFVFTGFANDKIKNTLIYNSVATIFPSFYEGFGLPLLESMYYDAPVISSNTSSLPEVGGEAALYFDPKDFYDLRNKMVELINNKELCDAMKKKGHENLKRFDWNNIATNVYKKIGSVLKEL